jgi:hypothetical protein
MFMSTLSRPSRRLILAALASAWAACAIAPAAAETFTLVGRTVIVDPPAGYCALDRARPAEAARIEVYAKAQEPGNRLLMQLADCSELAEFRAGSRSRIDRYGQILVPLTGGEIKRLDGYTRGQLLAEGAKEFPALDSSRLVDEVGKKLRESVPNADVGGGRFLGLLKQDDVAIYLGFAFENLTVDRQTIASGALGVFAITEVNEVPISLGLNRANVGAEAVPDLLAAVQAGIASLVTANAEVEARESSRWRWLGFDLSSIARGALVGATIGAVVWVWSRLRKKWKGA